MDSRNEMLLKVRLTAIEFLLGKIFAAVTHSLNDDQFDELVKGYSDGLDFQTFPGLDAASSDQLSAELRDEVLRLLNAVKAIRQSGY